MKIRKTISIDNNDLKILKPFLDTTGNNLSLALRKLIESYKQQTNIIDDQQANIIIRNQIVENRIAELIPIPLIKWMVRMSLGVPPLGVFRPIIEKFPKLLKMEEVTLANYIEMINRFIEIFGFQVNQHIELYPDLKKIRIFYEAEDSDHLKGTVVNFSCLLAHDPFKLKIINSIDSPGLYIIEYEQCSTEEEAYRSVKDYFGHKWIMLEDIQNNIYFWNSLSRLLKADNYEDVIINRDIFLRLLKSCDFSIQLNNLISSIYGVIVEETDYRHTIRMIEEILITNGLIHKIECNEFGIKIYHMFNDTNIINTINETILNTLKISGQSFKLKKSSKITVLSRATI